MPNLTVGSSSQCPAASSVGTEDSAEVSNQCVNQEVVNQEASQEAKRAEESSGPRWRRTNRAGMLSTLALVILGTGLIPANASLPGLPYAKPDILTSIAPAPEGGFWLQIQDDNAFSTPTPPGHTALYDGAPGYADVYHAGLIVPVPGTSGYWVVTRDGKIHPRGGAPNLCNGNLQTCSGFYGHARSYLTAIAATPTGQGFWAVGRDGKVWTAGDAISYGDATFDDAVPTGIVATPSGKGYYIVVDNGGVHAFGDAIFYGSTGGTQPGGNPITGIATSIDATGAVNGYWLVIRDGGVLACGHAPFWGSSGGTDSVVTSITSFRTSEPNNNALETVGYAWINKAGNVSMCTKDRPCGIPQVTYDCN
jgi:hypothetical protein